MCQFQTAQRYIQKQKLLWHFYLSLMLIYGFTQTWRNHTNKKGMEGYTFVIFIVNFLIKFPHNAGLFIYVYLYFLFII